MSWLADVAWLLYVVALFGIGYALGYVVHVFS
jgi:hypothetical protein